MAADEPALVRRLRAERAAHRNRPRAVRALAVLVGLAVTLGGLAMLVLPGPAFVVIPVGLALLSLEFRWAERALERAVAEGARARRRAARTGRALLALTATAIAIAVAVAVAVAWALLGDVPLLPV